MGQIENKYQDDRFKSHRIDNLIIRKGSNTPNERFSDWKKSMLPTVYKKIILNVKTQAKSKRMGKNILCKHH